MNKCVISGNLTKDSELKFISEIGKAVANFSVAVNDGWGDKKKTYFLNCICFGKIAEALANYTTKGSKVLVSGKIQTRSYDGKDGNKKYVTEIVADEVEFIGNKNKDENNSDIPY